MLRPRFLHQIQGIKGTDTVILGAAITERAVSAMMLASMAESRSRSNIVQCRDKKRQNSLVLCSLIRNFAAEI